jgi:hypothetical protein
LPNLSRSGGLLSNLFGSDLEFIHSFIIIHPFQLLVAASPLIALGFILFSAFEDPEAEALKRRKKGDFQLDGHAE